MKKDTNTFFNKDLIMIANLELKFYYFKDFVKNAFYCAIFYNNFRV
jgi:hypothetical protein